ncbi:hypothetical protein BDF14DRAFT_1846125 [Spinellus fusiger]|nr:hypothetical protein BDF14DRAFT_1846125 [Spinellus fusiger]
MNRMSYSSVRNATHHNMSAFYSAMRYILTTWPYKYTYKRPYFIFIRNTPTVVVTPLIRAESHTILDAFSSVDMINTDIRGYRCIYLPPYSP